jgi:AcrR family transcriptional regulator
MIYGREERERVALRSAVDTEQGAQGVNRRRWIETGDGEADALGDAQRARIVDATWRLIAGVGLERTTMRRIAEHVGCTTGLVTHYFASKDDVLLAALQRVTDQSDERMRAHGGTRGLARLRHLAESMLPLDDARAMEWRVWLAFWGRAYSDPGLMAGQRLRYERWRGAIARAMDDAAERGEITKECDVDDEVTRLVGLLMGLGVDSINLGTAGEDSGLLKVVDSHLATLKARPSVG